MTYDVYISVDMYITIYIYVYVYIKDLYWNSSNLTTDLIFVFNAYNLYIKRHRCTNVVSHQYLLNYITFEG